MTARGDWYVPDDADGQVTAELRALRARYHAALAARTGRRDPSTLLLDLDAIWRARADPDHESDK